MNETYFLEAATDNCIEESLTVCAIHDDKRGNTLFGHAPADTARR